MQVRVQEVVPEQHLEVGIHAERARRRVILAPAPNRRRQSLAALEGLAQHALRGQAADGPRRENLRGASEVAPEPTQVPRLHAQIRLARHGVRELPQRLLEVQPAKRGHAAQRPRRALQNLKIQEDLPRHAGMAHLHRDRARGEVRGGGRGGVRRRVRRKRRARQRVRGLAAAAAARARPLAALRRRGSEDAEPRAPRRARDVSKRRRSRRRRRRPRAARVNPKRLAPPASPGLRGDAPGELGVARRARRGHLRAEHGAVHLRHGPARHRVLGEVREDALYGHAQVPAHLARGLRVAVLGRVVVEVPHGVAEVAGEHVAPHARPLRPLHQRRAAERDGEVRGREGAPAQRRSYASRRRRVAAGPNPRA